MAFCTSSALAISEPPYPAKARARPTAELSQFSSADVWLICEADRFSSAWPVAIVTLAESANLCADYYAVVIHVNNVCVDLPVGMVYAELLNAVCDCEVLFTSDVDFACVTHLILLVGMSMVLC
jgi:hypothetical protein